MTLTRSARAVATHRDATKARGRFARRATRVAVWVALFAGAVLFMLPLWVMLAMSLKSADEIANTSMWAWPARATWENFRVVLTDADVNFARKAFNTAFISVSATTGVTLTSAIVAYPFARLRFMGRDRLFLVLLATMMLPGVVTMIPGYVLMAKLRWIDTYLPFIVPAFLGGGAFNVFLVRQAILAIPREMDEAARLDGAADGTIFWRVLLPNCGPVLATIAVLTFVGTFRDFLGPLMMLNSPEKMTLEVGLRALQGTYRTQFGLLMAGSAVVLAPIFLVFVLGQRYFTRGINLSGGK